MKNEQAKSKPIWDSNDEIVNEVRTARQAYAAGFGYNIARILDDLAHKAAEHPERYADLQPIVVPARCEPR